MSQRNALGLLIAVQLLLPGCSANKPGLGPSSEADLVSLIATSAPGAPCSPTNFPGNFAFATRIVEYWS